MVHFKLSSFGEELLSQHELHTVKEPLIQSERGIVFSLEDAKKAEPYLISMVHNKGLDKMISFFSVLKIMCSSEKRSLLCSENYKQAFDERGNKKMTDVYNFIRENFSRPISLERISRITHMSPFSFSRYFKKNCGSGFVEYLNTVRMNKACHLLRETEYQVQDISEQNVDFRAFQISINISGKARDCHHGITGHNLNNFCNLCFYTPFNHLLTMAMTMLEKILANHSKYEEVKPGDIVDIEIDARIARDFGGANVVKNINDFGLEIDDPEKTLFTFDCNPTGSDQKYAVNQHICRLFARNHGIRVYDIDAGIGTHVIIEEGIVFPGSTAISTDSHANILGAIGAFGQGMGDMDITSGWSKGKIWFRVPESVRIDIKGEIPDGISSKDVALNLLRVFGANSLLGYSVEIYGKAIENLSLDDRITISSMATEMGAIIILFPPSTEIVNFFEKRATRSFTPVYADSGATYSRTYRD